MKKDIEGDEQSVGTEESGSSRKLVKISEWKRSR